MGKYEQTYSLSLVAEFFFCGGIRMPRIYKLFKKRKQKVFYLEKTDHIEEIHTKEQIEIIDISLDNVYRVKDFREEWYVNKFHDFLNQGHLGIYALIGPEVVAHAWVKVSTSDSCRINGYFDISEGEAFIHYCNVNKLHRGKNIYPFMLTNLCRKLFRIERVRLVLIDTEQSNYASLRGISKAGFKPKGVCTYIQVAGRLIFKHQRNV